MSSPLDNAQTGPKEDGRGTWWNIPGHGHGWSSGDRLPDGTSRYYEHYIDEYGNEQIQGWEGTPGNWENFSK